MADTNTTPPLCACGCGTPVKRSVHYGRRGQWNTWIAGHSSRGSHHPLYRGGECLTLGYVFLKRPDHPHANANGYVRRSHLVAESVIGRLIQRGEHVHHKNGNKTDDRPENLEVLTAHEHGTRHKNHRRLTDAEIRAIRALRGTMRLKDVSVMFKTTISHVHRIQRGESWKDLP